MLNIINKLKPFFEDCYREISVREYAREMGISPPTASKLLNSFAKEGCLKRRGDRGFLLFRADRDSLELRDLSRVYWRKKLKGLIRVLRDGLFFDCVVLFGSLGKAEVTGDSDVDLAVFGKGEVDVDLGKFEEELGREIQVFRFESLGKVNKELRNNILNGYIMGGFLR